MRCSARRRCSGKLHLSALFVLTFASLAYAQNADGSTQNVQLSIGLPLHIRVTRTAHLRRGTAVEGLLTEPVYVSDRLVLPKGSLVSGVVSDLAVADRKIRTQALLNGDITPLHDPIVNFNRVRNQQIDITLESTASIRAAQFVRFTKTPRKSSLFQQVKTVTRDRVQSIHEQIFAPGKKDRGLKLFYSQLPYHPQRIWAGTEFIANLTDAVVVTLPAQPPAKIAEISSGLRDLDVTARLASTLSSDVAKKGDPITAIVIQPIFNQQHELILPEGTQLEGTVSQSKPSRSFGRNGQLRFAFQSVHRLGEDAKKTHGTLTGAEGNTSQNITVDDEGGVKSNPDKNRFVAPLLLGVLAIAGHDRDSDGSGLGRQTVASNGFGLVARVVALTANSRNVATGFGAYAFAKSIYFRFLTRGHPVSFPKDTLVEVQVSTR